MKKTLLTLALALSSLVAQAGPMEEIIASFKQAQAQSTDKEQVQASTETVIRGYISSNSGILSVPGTTGHVGALATRAIAEQAIATAGYVYVSTQRRVDYYRQAAPGADFGTILLVYYNTAGYCSEVYMLDDTL